MKIQLAPIDSLQAWHKNPRERDPKRFDWIKISLKKFGFVMPVFAREDGMLYSGHQRTGAAHELGFTQIPVVYLPGYEAATERGLNVLFNLCTNDHNTKADFGKKAAMELEAKIEAFNELPDATDPFPCLTNFEVIKPVDYQKQIDPLSFNNMTFLFAQTLCEMGIEIPIILNPNNEIINGVPRLMAAISYARVNYPAVKINENWEALGIFLNKITMSFNLQKAFGEELRYNSFFRRRNQAAQRTTLGVGFYHWVFAKEARTGGKEWLFQNLIKLEGENRSRFIAEHGTTCIDFGAGRLDNTNKLQDAGITCIPFEPYSMKPHSDEICYKGSKLIAIRFLSWLGTKPKIDSLFCSSVFNSVPFSEDREHLMVIFNFICTYGCTLYLHTLSDTNLGGRVFNNGVNASSRSDGAILLDTEPGLYINEVLNVPKVQKFHSEQELIAQGKRYFHNAIYYPANGSSHGIKCQGAKKLDPLLLVRALEFEFNLPYPGNKRMDLVNKALTEFSNFTGIDLFKVKENAENLR